MERYTLLRRRGFSLKQSRKFQVTFVVYMEQVRIPQSVDHLGNHFDLHLFEAGQKASILLIDRNLLDELLLDNAEYELDILGTNTVDVGHVEPRPLVALDCQVEGVLQSSRALLCFVQPAIGGGKRLFEFTILISEALKLAGHHLQLFLQAIDLALQVVCICECLSSIGFCLGYPLRGHLRMIGDQPIRLDLHC